MGAFWPATSKHSKRYSLTINKAVWFLFTLFCSDSSSALKKYPILYMLDLKTGWLLGPLKDKGELITSMQVIGDDLYFIDIHEDDDTTILKTVNLISMEERVVIKGSNGEQVQGFGCFSNSQGEVNLYVQLHGLKGASVSIF